MSELFFEYEYVKSKDVLMKQIDKCGGRHAQQVIYSTFHSGLTQVCLRLQEKKDWEDNIKRAIRKVTENWCVDTTRDYFI